MTCFFTLYIKASKATCSSNSFTLSISLLNLLKYARVNSPFYQATLKSYVEFFLAGILVLNCSTGLVQRLLNLSIEFGSKLLYQACTDPLKVVGSILHIETRSWMTNSKLLRIFYSCSLGLVKSSQLSKLISM